MLTKSPYYKDQKYLDSLLFNLIDPVNQTPCHKDISLENKCCREGFKISFLIAQILWCYSRMMVQSVANKGILLRFRKICSKAQKFISWIRKSQESEFQKVFSKENPLGLINEPSSLKNELCYLIDEFLPELVISREFCIEDFSKLFNMHQIIKEKFEKIDRSERDRPEEIIAIFDDMFDEKRKDIEKEIKRISSENTSEVFNRITWKIKLYCTLKMVCEYFSKLVGDLGHRELSIIQSHADKLGPWTDYMIDTLYDQFCTQFFNEAKKIDEPNKVAQENIEYWKKAREWLMSDKSGIKLIDDIAKNFGKITMDEAELKSLFKQYEGYYTIISTTHNPLDIKMR